MRLRNCSEFNVLKGRKMVLIARVNDNEPISSGNNRHNRTGDISTLIHGCNIDSAAITRRCNFVPRPLSPLCQGVARIKRCNDGHADVKKTPALTRGGKSSRSYAPHLCIPPCRRSPYRPDFCCIPTETCVTEEDERVTAWGSFSSRVVRLFRGL